MTLVLVEGAPAAALLRVGADAGAIVVGTRTRGAFSSLLMGTVSHTLVRRSTRPVAIVRAAFTTSSTTREIQAPAVTAGSR